MPGDGALISLCPMRNPIRLKNLDRRFLPLYVVGLLLLIWRPPEGERFGLALAPILLGLALRGWGAGHLVKTESLTTTGPYAYLRHPLYAGTLLIGSGFALLIGGWVSALLLALLWPWFAWHYYPRKEASEGQRLVARHGPRFERYRAAVPALLPRWPGWRDGEPGGGVASGRGADWRLARYSENNELGTLLAVSAGLLLFWLRALGERG